MPYLLQMILLLVDSLEKRSVVIHVVTCFLITESLITLPLFQGNIWDGRLTLLSTVTSASISKNIPCGVSSVACCNSTGHVYVGRDDGILSVYSDCLDEIHNINAHDNIITALSVNPFNSAQCISVCWDGRICLIDCDSNHMECHEGHSDMIYGVAHSPKRAGVFATVGKDSFMRIWDNRSLNEGCTALLPLQQIGSKCCWSSQSDNLIACGTEDGCINTIDIRTNGMMKTWSGQSHRITSLVSPSICTPNLDNRLISASVDKSICAQVFEAEEEPNQRRKRFVV